jgi:hypothetical protein
LYSTVWRRWKRPKTKNPLALSRSMKRIFPTVQGFQCERSLEPARSRVTVGSGVVHAERFAGGVDADRPTVAVDGAVAVLVEVGELLAEPRLEARPGGELVGDVAVDPDAQDGGDAVGAGIVVPLGVRVAQPDTAVRLVVLVEPLHEHVERQRVARLPLAHVALDPRDLLGGERCRLGRGRRRGDGRGGGRGRIRRLLGEGGESGHREGAEQRGVGDP